MVMEASGSRERKYCHCRGGGQRLMRTSRRLMERSTERLTTTGTNSEPPCCRPGRESEWGLAQPAGVHAAPQRAPEPSPSCPVPRENPAGGLCDWEPTSLPRGPQGECAEERDLSQALGRGPGGSQQPVTQGCPHLKAQLGREGVVFPHGVHALIQPQGLGIWGALVKDRA